MRTTPDGIPACHVSRSFFISFYFIIFIIFCKSRKTIETRLVELFLFGNLINLTRVERRIVVRDVTF